MYYLSRAIAFVACLAFSLICPSIWLGLVAVLIAMVVIRPVGTDRRAVSSQVGTDRRAVSNQVGTDRRAVSNPHGGPQ